MSDKRKKILAMKDAPYSIVNRLLCKLGLHKELHCCVLDHERESIMHESHYDSARGHFQSDMTPKKIP